MKGGQGGGFAEDRDALVGGQQTFTVLCDIVKEQVVEFSSVCPGSWGDKGTMYITADRRQETACSFALYFAKVLST